MTFDDWNNIVTSNAYWINLVLVMIILVVFYRHYREIHIRYEEVITISCVEEHNSIV